jgi:hypothetical protein
LGFALSVTNSREIERAAGAQVGRQHTCSRRNHS